MDEQPSCSHSSSKSFGEMLSPDEKRLVVSLSDSTSSDEDDNVEEQQASVLKSLTINDKLEEKLKKHGLNRRNVKTIIHELLNDENVANILQASLDENKSPPKLPEHKNLRSKQKSTPQPKTAPTFTEIQFQDDDEEEDEEYKPELEETMDTEDCMSQDTMTSTHELDTSLEETDKMTEIAVADGAGMLATSPSFIEDLNQIDSELKAIDEGTPANEEEIIARRTRSKHSLLDIAMAEIEMAFHPPDVTEDMYFPTGDEEWHKWLAELMMDDKPTNKSDAQEEDDKETDPDYNFIASEMDDVNDMEDLRDDPATHISKKEVQELLELLEVPAIDYKGQNIKPQPQPKTKERNFHKQVSFLQKPPTLNNNRVTVKQHLKFVHNQTTNQPAELDKHIIPQGNSFTFTEKQKHDLNLQMRQHVQLLTQLNLLCRNSSKLAQIVEDSQDLLNELEHLGSYNKATMNISNSCFSVPTLNEALQIVQRPIKDSDPVTRLSKQERNKGLIPIPRNIAVVMATSGVFQFSDLLPISSAVCDQTRLTFTVPEDNLLTLGLAQMEGHSISSNILIHQYMMPSKQPEQIRWRITNAKHRQYRPDNPIRIFRSSGKLPNPPPLLCPDAGEGTKAPNLLHVESTKHPGWLIALQQEEKRKQQDPMICLHEEIVGGLHSSRNPLPTVSSVQQSSMLQNNVVIRCPPQVTLPACAMLLPAIVTKPTNVKHLTPIRSRPVPESFNSPQKKLVNLKKRRNDSKSPKQPKINKSDKNDEKKITQKKTNPVQSEVASRNSRQEVDLHVSKLTDKPMTTSQQEQRDTDQFIHVKPVDPKVDEENSRISEVGGKVDKKKKSKIEKVTMSPPHVDDPAPPEDVHDDDEGLTEDDEFYDIDTEEEEAPVKSGGEKEDDVASDEDTLTEEDMMEINEEEKEEHKKRKKSDDEDAMWRKGRRVRWKNRSGKILKKLGGRLHRLHPGLSGKKPRIVDEDQLSRRLRKSAENVRLLEEETIVQLDPSRVEKEMMFAEGYLKKMEEELKDHPDILVNILDIMCQFNVDSTQSPSSLFFQLSEILQPWPNLLKGFAPFLLPEQAHICGLLPEQQVYARARKFLRQLEIRFHDNPHHLNRILSAFHAVAEGPIHTEQEMKKVILGLLKTDIYLQEEFLTFFDDERPPESRLHGDYEEIIWSDDLHKDAGSSFEQIYIPSAEVHDNLPGVEDGQGDDLVKISHPNKPRNKDFNTMKENVDPRQSNDEEMQHCTGSREDGLEEAPRSEEESDVEDMEQCDPHRMESSFPPPDIVVISEDALSCSPFKRHNSATSLHHTHDRPKTPTNSLESHETISLPDRGDADAQSSSVGSDLPNTPTGSPDKKLFRKRSNDEPKESWTRNDDAILLSICKEMGPSKEAFQKASEVLKRQDTETRFGHLMALLTSDDTDESGQDGSEESDFTDE